MCTIQKKGDVAVSNNYRAVTLQHYYYYYRYSALGPFWAETRAQSGITYKILVNILYSYVKLVPYA